ncbi:hypothetical protein L2E82_19830 [Cichorium intybus]|uniref:Uncharacterized protein n=1 Tax=Cichorium intybus TaxID=13427 RepID=A0ACB9DSD6_CICIN|nr:hypothetical protein L2E82_19830 [Cichorium intybus]
MGSELIYRGHEPQPTSDLYSPKPNKPWSAVIPPIRYMLREQRLVFVLIGIAIATFFFAFIPSSTTFSPPTTSAYTSYSVSGSAQIINPQRPVYRFQSGGKIPLGLKRKGLRIVVTGGAGFTNVVGTLNMLGLAKRVGARFLLTSTSEVYGDPLQHPQVETYWGNVNPIGESFLSVFRQSGDKYTGNPEEFSDYGALIPPLLSKFVEIVPCDFNLVRIARIFNTYGPRMCIDDGRVVSNFVAQALRKEPMTVYGDGKQTRSFQFVSDLVEGLMRLMEGEHVGPFNLGNPGEFTMLELAQVVQETIDPDAKIEFRPNTEDDPHKRKPDITKAKDLLGWEPKVALRKGLPMMVTDFRQRIFGDHKDMGATV